MPGSELPLPTDQAPPAAAGLAAHAACPPTDSFAHTRALLDELRLHTVCQSAACPNHWECWSKGTATFMIGGDRCTRACGFCAVTTAKPFALEADEPARVAEATRRLRLRHVVITAVARDDLPDGGADHFRRTIEAVRALNPAHGHRSADARLQRPRGGHRHRAGRPPAHLQPQPRDRAPADAGGAVAGDLRPVAERAGPGEGEARRDDLHQVRPDAGPGRDRGGAVHRPGRLAPASAATCSRWASICSRRSSICRWWSS